MGKLGFVRANKVIVTHENTDFDALASLVAASLLYKNSVITISKNLNVNVGAFLSIHKDLIDYIDIKNIDLNCIKTLIVVDTSVWKRLGKISSLMVRNNIEILIWDHHYNQCDMESSFKCCRPVGANITLLVMELIKNKIKITPVQATLFLLGIYEDTGNLTFISTTPEDAYIVSYLLRNKADLNVVNKFLQPTYNVRQKNVFFRMLKISDRIKINGYSISICKIELEGHVDNLASLVRMYRDVLNVDAAFGIFIRFDKKGNSSRCIIIGRSSSEDLNIGYIMKQLGGGGHSCAGSATLKSININAINKKLFELIKQSFNINIRVKDIMSYPVFSIQPDVTLKKAENIMTKKGYSGIPVINKGKLVGIISKRDLEKATHLSKNNLPVKALMSKNVKTISPSKTPLYAAKIMMKYDIGRLLVIDNNRIIGIITRTDSMSFFYDL